MKIVIVILLCALGAEAQSVTNGQTITFTNKAGRVYDAVRIERIEPHGVIWFTSPTVGGFAKFSEMSDSTRASFAINTTAERAAILAEAARNAARVEAMKPKPTAPVLVPEPIPDAGIVFSVLSRGTSQRVQQDQADRWRDLNWGMQLRGSEFRTSQPARIWR